MSPRDLKLDPDRLVALEEQRDFLLRSIEDLDAEREAGDLSDEDYAALRDDYTARAATVLRSIDEQRTGMKDAARPRSLGRTLAIAAVVCGFALIAGFVAAGAMGARKAGESASGGVSVRQTPSQRANECIPKIQSDPPGALQCFEDILKEDDSNPVALTWEAWLLSLTSQQTKDPVEALRLGSLAAVRVNTAVESDPNYSYARAFRAIIAYRNGRFEEAKDYLADFRGNNPSAEAQQVIEQMGLDDAIAEAIRTQSEMESTTTTATTTTVPSN